MATFAWGVGTVLVLFLLQVHEEWRVASLSVRLLTLPGSFSDGGHAMCECILRLPSFEFSS